MLEAPWVGNPPEDEEYSMHYAYYGERLQIGTRVIDDLEFYFDIDDRYEVDEFCKNLIEEDFELVKEIIMDYMEDFYGTKTLDE